MEMSGQLHALAALLPGKRYPVTITREGGWPQSWFGRYGKANCPCAWLIKHYALWAYWGMDVYIHVFLTSALAGGEWSVSSPSRFNPGEKATGIHWIGGWVERRGGLDDVEKRKFFILPGLELRLLGRPARSQSLYRLSYPGPSLRGIWTRNKWRLYLYGGTRELIRNEKNENTAAGAGGNEEKW
jgi:hypothetical protein